MNKVIYYCLLPLLEGQRHEYKNIDLFTDASLESRTVFGM